MENIGLINSDFFFFFFVILLISLPQLFLAGSVAGLMNSIIITPVERVKCVLQAQEATKKDKNVPAKEYKGSFDCARQLYQKGGIKDLYQGAVITIIRGKLYFAIYIYTISYCIYYIGAPSSAVYFSTYECLRRTLISDGQS